MGTDDSTPGQVYMYVGNKQAAGNDVERAGLTNGTLYGVRVAGTPNELRAAPPAAATPFSLFNEGNVENMTGAALNAQSNANNVTSFLRPEDGAWDARPGHENNFYFVTTDAFNSNGFNGRSRLWQMTFNDISNPELGGDLTCLMDGTQGQQMFDNMTIDSLGRILLQEDPGNQGHLAKVWLYDIASKNYAIVAQADSSRFLIGGSNYLGTQDEESSGIIDAKDTLGLGWFLMDTQAHYGIPGELVEGGQLMAFYVDPSVVPAPGSIALLGLAAIVGGRRRR